MVHDISLRFLIDGAWTDFTSHLSASTDPLEWAHGRPDEASQSDPSGCSFSLVDPTGRFVEENPRSDLFGKFGRGTLGAIRWDVDPQDHYVDLPGHDSQDCYVPFSSAFNTVDKALRFTVDCETAAEFSSWLEEPSDLYPEKRVLMSRWGGESLRAWRFYITRDGYLGVTVSDNGTTVTDSRATATVGSLFPSGRLELRASFDGFNGRWVFSANDGVSGFVQIGATVVGSSTVDDAAVAVRLGSQSPDSSQPAGAFHGRIYRGTVEYGNFSSSTTYPNVSFDADFRAAETAISPLPDGTRIEGSATLVDPSLVFIGEVVSTTHGGDKAEATQFTTVTMAGLSRRLNPPDSPVGSVYRTAMRSGQGAELLAYWPCEDPEGAEAFGSLVTGTPALAFKANDGTLIPTELADDSEWVASDALPTWNQVGVQATLAGPVPAAGDHGFTLAFFVKLPAAGLPVAKVDFARVTFSGGETANIVVGFTNTGLVNVYFDASPGFPPTAVISNGNVGNLLGRAACLVLQVRPHPTTPISNSAYELWALYEDGTSASITGTYTADLGQLVRFDTQPLADTDYTDGDLDGTTVGQVAIWATGRRPDPVYPEYVPNIHQRFRAYFGERAGTRILRRSAEDAIPVRLEGNHLDSMLMGNMQRGTSPEQRLAAEKADGGILYDSPTSYSLVYRTLASMLNQWELSLSYGDGLFDDPWAPVFDDQHLRNDVTVTRTGGGVARAELETGPRSVQEPPNGARRHEVEEERQLAYDSQLQPYADWLVSIGTAPGGRMPEVAFNIGNARVAAQLSSLRALKPGDRLQITDPPAWMSPEHVELLIQAITWTLYPGTDVGTLALTCIPGEPWLTGFAEDTAFASLGFPSPHADLTEATLVHGLDASGTSAVVATQAGHTLTEDPADLGNEFELVLGDPQWGTQETVGLALGGGPFVDTFTRVVAAPNWGSPDVGSAWVTAVAGGATTSVNGTQGVFGNMVALADARAYTSTDADGWDVYGDFVVTNFLSGSNLRVVWRLNWDVAAGDYYEVVATIPASGSVTLQCFKVVNSVVVQTGTLATRPFTNGFNTTYTFRVRALDGHVQAHLTQATPSLDTPPTAWHAELLASGDALPAGRFGLLSNRLSGATSTVTVAWNNVRTVRAVGPFIWDEFARATSHPVWGPLDIGGTWLTFASGAAQTFVSGGTGILGTLSSSTDAGAYTPEDGDGWDVEGRFFLSAVPTGSDLLVAWRMNWEPVTGDFYQVGLTISPGGAAVLQCAKVVNGSVVSSGSVVNVPFTFSTTNVAFRVSAKKGTVRVLLRQANDMGEWTGWQAELATDGDPLPKGRFGVYAFRGASATNGPNVRWERLFSNSPQRVALQRGARSDYSTAHADGTPVALRYPWAIGP